MKIYFKHYPSFIYVCLVLSTGLVSNFGALDRIATQWLYLSFVNTIGLVHFLYKENTREILKNFLSFKPLIALLLFVLWGLISFFYSINDAEVLVKFVRWVQLPITIFILSIIYYNSNDIDFIKIISVIISIVLVVELYFSYSPYFQLIEYTKYNFSFANILKGATGNKNITAASILIKTPFVIYLIYNINNRFTRILFSIINYSAFYLVFLLSARASIIGFFSVFSVLIISITIKMIKTKTIIKDSAIWMIIGSFILSSLIFQVNFRNDNSASFSKRVSTINTNDESTQQRLRFYRHSVDQIISNPIIGVGLGNWKIKSVDYDKNDVKAYIIPYHTHNDFLEIGTELGLIGLLLYLLIFYFPLKDVLRNQSGEAINVNTLILFCGIIYFIDANLNFPHARPVMQIPFILILVMSFIQKNKTKNVSI
jgi:O-antigen ligase